MLNALSKEGREAVGESAKVSVTKYHSPGGLAVEMYFLGSGGWDSGIEELAGLLLGQNLPQVPLLGLHVAIFSYFPHHRLFAHVCLNFLFL